MSSEISKLYGAQTGNSYRAAIALEEAGFPHEIVKVDLGAGEQHHDSFLAINPRAQVPVLVMPGSQPEILTQSSAIILYAAGGTSLLPDTPAERWPVMERFLFFYTDVISPSNAAFRLRRYDHAAAATTIDKEAAQTACMVERFLADQPFVAGKHFSIADIAALTIIRFVRSHMDLDSMPATSDWLERVEARPAVERGLCAFN